MANETRVNLKHLLEDLRDAYASPVEEVIVTELIANALDSGATQIHFGTDPEQRIFCCRDNGTGMNREALRSYHNIAASTKERGAGIGFAGVGAKLSLLVAEKVVTESRGKHGTQSAAEWYLKNAFRAPWKFVPFSGCIESGKGTAVTIVLRERESSILDPLFLIKTVQRHFYPLVAHNDVIDKMLKTVYQKPVEIFVNEERVSVQPLGGRTRSFFVQLGKSRKAIGAGFIEKANMDENFWSRLFGRDSERPTDGGLRISTYGKVIRGGWEWLGISLKHPELLTGVVEVPALSEVLTTNKSDFLTTPTALKKYYDVRKSIQRAVLPVLCELGEVDEKTDERKTPKEFKPLTQDIDGALSRMSETFPELQSLVGEHWKRRMASEGKGHPREMSVAAESLQNVQAQKKIREVLLFEKRTRSALDVDPEGKQTKRERQPGIEIAFEDFLEESSCMLLGKLIEEKVIVNTAHPAWKRAEHLGQEPYHVLVTVALTLGDYLQSPQGLSPFVSDFLKAWSEAAEKSGKLL